MLDSKVLKYGNDNSRLCQANVRGKKFLTPVYFASITTASIRGSLGALIDAIYELPYPNLLVSTYDIYHSYDEVNRKKITDLLKQYSLTGNFVFADSGIFELNTLKRNDWSYDLYEKIITSMEYDFFASYDVESPSSKEYSELLSLTNQRLVKSLSLSNGGGQFMTLFRTFNIAETSKLIEDVISSNNEYSSYVAVTERDIGKNLLDNYRSIKKIRETVNKYNSNGLIHVLGCGDPISMAVMSYAGADSFDSVDWNRWVINPNTMESENITHINIIDCDCEACTEKIMDDRDRAYKHNLLLYRRYIEDLRYAIGSGIPLITFLKERNIDQKKITKMETIFNK